MASEPGRTGTIKHWLGVMGEIETISRLILAEALGFIIGLEREAAGQSAGERTHALVALGSAAFTILPITAFPVPTCRELPSA